MKIIVSENQLLSLVKNLGRKKPTVSGYETTKNELSKLAQSNNNLGFGEGISQREDVAKEKAVSVVIAALKSKTGKSAPFNIVHDRLFQVGNMYHQLIVIELRA